MRDHKGEHLQAARLLMLYVEKVKGGEVTHRFLGLFLFWVVII